MLLALLFATASPEAELLEDDVALPTDYTWSELLLDLRANPLDVNSASTMELRQIPFLTPADIEHIVEYRIRQQGIRDLEELARLPGIDSQLVEEIRPYVRTAKRRSKIRGSAATRIKCDSIGSASPLSRLASEEQVRAELADLAVSFVAARDPREASYLDFLSGGIQYHWSATSLIGGDYELHGGQGLVFARPHSFQSLAGLSRTPLLPVAGLSVASSENSRLTGLTLAQGVGPFEFEVFAARSRWDATPNSDSTIHAITYDGLHDDSTSRTNRHRLQEDLIGGRVGFRRSAYRFSVNGFGNRYDKTIRTSGFGGTGLSVISADFRGRFTNYELGSEVAHSAGHGWAGALDLAGDWDWFRTHLDLVFLQKDFYSPHGRSRSLQRTTDELGATLSLRYRWRTWGFNLYGATGQNFVSDSMPERVELSLENRASPLQVGLRWKQTFRNESPLNGGSRIDLAYKTRLGLSVVARYEDRLKLAELGHRTMLLMLGADYRRPALDAELRVIRVLGDSSGPGIYAYESGFPGNNIRFEGSAWRASAGGSLPIVRPLRLGVKFGVTMTTTIDYDAGLELLANLGE
jgi:hypothetical protein